MDLMPYQESKYFLKHLIPLLIKVLEFLRNNVEQDTLITNIKSLSIDIFTRVIWDNELLEVYQLVLESYNK
jgi:hypothetical protein